MPEKKKDKEKNTAVIVICTVGGVIVAIILFLLIFSDYIVVDNCASPCGKDYKGACPSVCVKRTLHDVIFGG